MFSSPASHTSLTRNSLETWDALSILLLGHYELNHVFLCGRCRRCLLIMWLYFNIGPWDLQGPCLRLNEKNTTVGAQTYKTRALTSRGRATVFCPVLWTRGHLRKQLEGVYVWAKWRLLFRNWGLASSGSWLVASILLNHKRTNCRGLEIHSRRWT